MKSIRILFVFGILFFSTSVSAQNYEIQVNTPSYSAIPKNATRVPLLKVTIKTQENLFLSQLWVRAGGMVSSQDFESVWAQTGGFQRSMKTRFSRDNQAVIRFFVPVFIPAGTSQNFTLFGNFDAESGGRSFDFILENIVFINSSTDPFFLQDTESVIPVSISTPQKTQTQPIQQLTSFDIAEISFQSLGSRGNIRIGRTSEIGKFRLSNTSRKDVQLQNIRFRNYGNSNLEKSFDGFVLRENGQEIATQFSVEGDYLTLQFEDYSLEKGDSSIFSLQARLIYAQQNNTVEIGIPSGEDFVALVKGTQFGARLNDFKGVRLQEHTLSPGGISSSFKSFRSRYRNYRNSRRTKSLTLLPVLDVSTPGARDVLFFRTFFSQKNDFSVDGVFIPIDNGTNVSDKDGNGIDTEVSDLERTYNSFQFFIDEQEIDSTNDFTMRAGRIGLEFDTEFVILPTSQMRIVGRITQEAIEGDKIKFDRSHVEFYSPDSR